MKKQIEKLIEWLNGSKYTYLYITPASRLETFIILTVASLGLIGFVALCILAKHLLIR